MTTLLVRLPPAFEEAPPDPECAYARLSARGELERQGTCPLSALADEVARAGRVVALLAAGDATLLHLKAPPLSAAKLKTALPFLVEEHLLSDPAGCAIVAGPEEQGMRLIAVARRDLLERIAAAFAHMQARSLRLLPAPLCLPWAEGVACAAVRRHAQGSEVALRTSAHGAFGLTLAPPDDAPAPLLAALRLLHPQGRLTLLAPPAELAAWNAAAAADDGVAVTADDWHHWLAGALACPLDLATAPGSRWPGRRVQWQAWRLPLALAAATLALNVAALNLDWWRLSRQAAQLKMAMTSAYRQAYPADKLIVDPLAQARQHRNAALKGAAPDDFGKLLAKFGAAWEQLGPARKDLALVTLDYGNGALSVSFSGDADALAVEQAWKQALAAQQLSATRPGAGIWRITMVEQ